MHAARHWISQTLPVVILLSLSGCGVENYYSEMTIHPDGSIDRAIFQSRDQVPQEAKNEKLWDKVTHAEKYPTKGSIRDLPDAPADDEHPYFAAWGHFDSVEKLPNHFVRKSPDETKKGKFKRSYTRNDYLLVVDHRFEEMLTDIVTLNDMHKAQREMTTLGISVFRDILTEGLGPNYDLSKLVTWLRTEGREWCYDLVSVYVDISVRKPTDRDEQMQQRFFQICAGHGLKLPTDKEELAGDEKVVVVREFVEKKLRDTIVRKDGHPLDEATVEMVLTWMNLMTIQDEKGEAIPSALNSVAENVIKEKYGGNEKLKKRFDVLASRIFGVYSTPIEIFRTRHLFSHTLEMPGKVAETNGLLTSNNKVKWKFEAGDAFPFGYPMRCRSLEPIFSLQKELLNATPLTERAAMLEYIEIVSQDDALLATLRKCVEMNSTALLHDFRAVVSQGEDDAQKQRVRTLWKLLKLPI